jgi:hypothetical protein
MDGTAVATIIIGFGATLSAMVFQGKYPTPSRWQVEFGWWSGIILMVAGTAYLVYEHGMHLLPPHVWIYGGLIAVAVGLFATTMGVRLSSGPPVVSATTYSTQPVSEGGPGSSSKDIAFKNVKNSSISYNTVVAPFDSFKAHDIEGSTIVENRFLSTKGQPPPPDHPAPFSGIIIDGVMAANGNNGELTSVLIKLSITNDTPTALRVFSWNCVLELDGKTYEAQVVNSSDVTFKKTDADGSLEVSASDLIQQKAATPVAPSHTVEGYLYTIFKIAKNDINGKEIKILIMFRDENLSSYIMPMQAKLN